jgi:hypothetical protein
VEAAVWARLGLLVIRKNTADGGHIFERFKRIWKRSAVILARGWHRQDGKAAKQACGEEKAQKPWKDA